MPSKSGIGEHTADMVFWVEADGEAELYQSAAAALGELMFSGPRDGELSWLPLELEAEDRAELLVGLLGEVVYLADGEGLLCAACKVTEAGRQRLSARLGVLPLNPALHRPREPVKAVTHHQAMMEEAGNGRWRAQVVLDV